MPGFSRRLRAVHDEADAAAASDEDLVAAVVRGDYEAFEALYDRVVGKVYGVVRRVLRDPAQSEEVTQEVLVEVWRSASRFDPDHASVSTWVVMMAHRRAVDRVRSEQAHRDRDERVGRSDMTRGFDSVSGTGGDPYRT